MKTFKLNNRRPLATLSLSAFYALGIFDTNDVQGDEVLVAFYNDEERGRFSWCKLYENAEGDVFFKKFGKKILLKRFFKNTLTVTKNYAIMNTTNESEVLKHG